MARVVANPRYDDSQEPRKLLVAAVQAILEAIPPDTKSVSLDTIADMLRDPRATEGVLEQIARDLGYRVFPSAVDVPDKETPEVTRLEGAVVVEPAPEVNLEAPGVLLGALSISSVPEPPKVKPSILERVAGIFRV